MTIFSPWIVGKARRAGRSRGSELHGEPAVLGEAPLRDVEVRHDLDARQDGRLHLLGRVHHVVEHAVDPVAHAEDLLVRLQVDVRGALPDGVGDDQVHEPDRRGLFGLAPTAAMSTFDGLHQLEIGVAAGGLLIDELP